MYPIRLASADIGSNAMRFLAVEFISRHEWRILHQIRVPLRLGHDVFLTGSISESAKQKTVAALADFAAVIRKEKITALRAVATSALRESSNGAEVVAAVRAATGIEIEVIDGTEEARLGYLAIHERMRLGAEPWLLADLGGGSLELSLVDQHSVSQTVSLPLGAVRLMEAVGASGDVAAFQSRIMQNDSELRRAPALNSRIAGMIATGGSADAIARMLGASSKDRRVSRVERTALRAAAEQLAGTPVAERAARFRLQPDRADVILPAALIYERVAELAGASEIMVPSVGVKEGILIDLLPDSSPRS